MYVSVSVTSTSIAIILACHQNVAKSQGNRVLHGKESLAERN